jgi:hypothetical protein
MLLSQDEFLHLSYFQEKTGIKDEGDAVALLCFIAQVCGVEVGGVPAEYTNENWFQHARGLH